MAKIGQDIAYAAQLIAGGSLVAMPTETVYGLAASAVNTEAVARIFEVKKRPSFDPLIVHLAHRDWLDEFVLNIPREANLLAAAFWPGPLTLLLKKKPNISDLVTSGLPDVAVRVPAHPMAQALLQTLDVPLAAPSANPFGYVSPTTAQHVNDQLGDHIPYILDGGPCAVGLESTIVGFEDGRPVVYRKGGLAVEDIENIIGPVGVRDHSTSTPKSPGMLSRHYSPATQVLYGNIEENLLKLNDDTRVGILSFNRMMPQLNKERQFVLSAKGDMKEAAARLFAGLRHLDALNLSHILCEPVPDAGLGAAINDRLRRSAAQSTIEN